MVELLLAVLAGQDLELVWDVADFVPDEAEELIVHVAFFEDFDEVGVVQLVEDGECQRFYFVERAFFGEEVQASQEGDVSIAYFNEVDYLIIQNPLFLAYVPDFSLFEDHEVEIVIDTPDDFLGMRDLGLKMLCEVVKRAVEEIPEEDKFLQNCLIGLSKVTGP